MRLPRPLRLPHCHSRNCLNRSGLDLLRRRSSSCSRRNGSKTSHLPRTIFSAPPSSPPRSAPTEPTATAPDAAARAPVMAAWPGGFLVDNSVRAAPAIDSTHTMEAPPSTRRKQGHNARKCRLSWRALQPSSREAARNGHSHAGFRRRQPMYDYEGTVLREKQEGGEETCFWPGPITWLRSECVRAEDLQPLTPRLRGSPVVALRLYHSVDGDRLHS